MDIIDRVLNELGKGNPLLRSKKLACEGSRRFPGNAAILKRYHAEVRSGSRVENAAIERALVLNKVRSESGVVTITVMTKPFPCPGRCIYCPTEKNVPKSYLSNEPPVLRALHTKYDAYGQFLYRLKALKNTGHRSGKIELIIKGGTWSSYPREYQESFIQRCLDAANESTSDSLKAAQTLNESAHHRVVGLTIETRPDSVSPGEIQQLRTLGVTRVELGVQSLDDTVLKASIRDHDVAGVRSATRLLKDAGFKVAFHMMPNSPGADPKSDLESLRRLYDDPDFRPDGLKIYPCVVVDSAPLYTLWKKGEYRSYEDQALIDLLVEAKKHVPRYTRLERVIRDVPAPDVQSGCATSNLRERVLEKLKEEGFSCRCIRCRQIRDSGAGQFNFFKEEFDASGAREFFLSFEDASRNRLAAFLRLRISADRADVRELHTYGWQLPVEPGTANDTSGQHRGYGQRLLKAAEDLAFERFGCHTVRVISGVGARGYYRKLGYRLEESYMVKERSGAKHPPL